MPFDGIPLGLVLLLIAVAMGMLWRSRTLQTKTGLPPGEVIYDDTGAWFPNEETLVAPHFQLVGKPDYLVEQGDGTIIPVELKSGQAPGEPWEGHVLQLAAYCLLVHESYGRRPDFGILQYKDYAFAVEYTEALEEDLLSVLSEMRNAMLESDLDRDHQDWQLCDQCGVRQMCVQRLA